MKILSWLCLFSIAVVDNIATKKMVANFERDNEQCDYPIKVSSGKVIHLELRNVQEINRITFHRDLTKFGLKVLSLEREHGDIDVITSTNTVCVQLDDNKFPLDPAATIEYSEMDPPEMSEGGRCGETYLEGYHRFSSFNIKTNVRTFLLCDITYVGQNKENTYVDAFQTRKPSAMMFDVFYDDTQFEEYDVTRALRSSGYIITGRHIRVRHTIFLNAGVQYETRGFVSQYSDLPTPNGKCGDLLTNQAGVLHSPLLNPGFSGYVICDRTVRIKKPSRITISVNQFKNPSNAETGLSVRSLDGKFRLSNIPPIEGMAFVQQVKNDVVIRYYHAVKQGKVAAITVAYTVKPV